MIKRVFYFFYYLKNLDTERFWLFFSYVKKQHRMSSFALMADVFCSSLKYNISPLEYFQFHFYSLEIVERKEYAGTGFMYEYQLTMNPRSSRQVLADKAAFFKKYSPFIHRLSADLATLQKDEGVRTALLNNMSGKIVLKYSHGQCGWQVMIVETQYFQNEDLISFMEHKGFDLAEEFVVQHSDLVALSPSGVNTVRVITQLNSINEVEFLGARLRISENSKVDNLASGNFAASLDIDTGVVNGPGVYSDITKNDVTVHPVTSVPIVGFEVPFWPEIIDMVEKAAVHVLDNRSVGWDVAVTKTGPELIEGNHDWCKLVWQLPVHKGLKTILDRHLTEF